MTTSWPSLYRRILAASVLLLLCGVFIFGLVTKYQLDRHSRGMAVSVTEAAISHWNPDPLIANADDVLLQAESVLRLHFASLRRLGELQGIKSIVGQAQPASFLSPSERATALYVIQAQFQNGRAEIQARLMHTKGKWRFTEFNIGAPVSLPRNAG